MNNNKSRSKLLIENFIIYGFGSVAGQVIPLIMLPILTRIYPSPDYIGLNDSVNILVAFASQIAILGIADIMFRYFFEEEGESYQKKVTSTAFFTLVVSGLVVAALVAVLRKTLANLVMGDSNYTNLVLISSVTLYFTALNAVTGLPTRMRNQRIRYLLVNIGSSIISYSIAIPMLFMGWYETAMPLAMMFTMIITFITFMIMNHKDFSLSVFDGDMLLKLLKLSLPSMPSFVFYWILSSAQRIFVTNMLGMEATGVYSVGAKISAVSQLVYSAFAMGWQYFVFSTMKDKDRREVISKVFDYLVGISFFSVCVMVLSSHPIFKLLFEPEYLEGAWIMPVLFLCPLIQMLYQSITSEYTIIKKTYVGPICLAVGTLICVALDFLLIPVIGISGAAIANLLGFTVTLLIMALLLKRRKLVFYKGRIIYCGLAAYLTLTVFAMKTPAIVYFTVASVSTLLVFLMYYKDGLAILKGLVNNLRPKTN